MEACRQSARMRLWKVVAARYRNGGYRQGNRLAALSGYRSVSHSLRFSVGPRDGHDRANLWRRNHSESWAVGRLNRLRNAAIADRGDRPESYPRCRKSA